MKKILVLTLTLVMVLGLMGCSGLSNGEHIDIDELLEIYVDNEFGTDYTYKIETVAYDTEDPCKTDYIFIVLPEDSDGSEDDYVWSVKTTRGNLDKYYDSWVNEGNEGLFDKFSNKVEELLEK